MTTRIIIGGVYVDVVDDGTNLTIDLDATAVPELIRDTIAAALVAGANITITPNDGANTITVAATAPSFVVLGSDVTNNNASANTIADVTGLSFAVVAGNKYWFKFVIPYTSAATTTGSRWAVNGPAVTRLNYTSRYTLTATTETVNYADAYDIPAASNATALTSGNLAIIEGIIVPSANGTVIARFASEVSSSAIVAKAGAVCQYQQVA